MKYIWSAKAGNLLVPQARCLLTFTDESSAVCLSLSLPPRSWHSAVPRHYLNQMHSIFPLLKCIKYAQSSTINTVIRLLCSTTNPQSYVPMTDVLQINQASRGQLEVFADSSKRSWDLRSIMILWKHKPNKKPSNKPHLKYLQLQQISTKPVKAIQWFMGVGQTACIVYLRTTSLGHSGCV